MKIKQFKVAVPVGNTVQTIDGLEYENKLWLVALWVDSPEKKLSKPELMIRFDQLEFHSFEHPNPHHFSLSHPIPKAVLEGQSVDGYETLTGNDIMFAFPFSPHGSVFH